MEGVSKTPSSSGTLFHSDPQTNHHSPYTSGIHDGISANGSIRDGCIQEVNEKSAKALEPEGVKRRKAAKSSFRRNVSPTKRERETCMVQVSQSLLEKLMKAEMTHKQQNVHKSTSDFSLVPEGETKNEDQECRMNQAASFFSAQNANESKAGEVVFGPDAVQSDGEEECDMDPIPESPSPVKGWVIGPLFQSFKSKMASFTEIVMSPVKLFKPTNVWQSTVNLDAEHVVNGNRCDAVNLEGHLEKLDDNECRTDTETGLIQDEKAGSCNSLDSEQGGLEAQGKHFARSRGPTGERIAQQKHSAVLKHRVFQKPSVVQKLHFDFKSGHLLGEDERAIETRQSIVASNKQNDTITGKEKNNNDLVPCKRSRFLQSSIKPGPESTESSSPPLSSTLSDDTSASCESQLKPDIQMAEQMGLTGTRQKPSRRKRSVGPRSTAKSGFSKTASSEMPCNSAVAEELHTASRSPQIDGGQFALKCDSQSTMSHSKDTQSSILSSMYYTPPDSLCSLVDGGKRHSDLHGNQDTLVCGVQSHISVKNSPEKTSTDNGKGPASRMGDSKPLQPQLEEVSEEKRFVGSTKREKKSKVAASTGVERNFEKRKRVKLMREEQCVGQMEAEGLAVVESSTSASLDHKEHLESWRPRVSRKRGSAKSPYQNVTPKTASSATVDTEDILELPETNATVTITKGKGTGRKGNAQLNVSHPAKATSLTTGQEGPTVMKSTDGLTKGNSKVKRAVVSKEQDCISNAKRLKQQKNACYSHSQSGSMELNTIPVVNDPNSGGVGQHTKGRSEPSRTLEKVYRKKRSVASNERKPSWKERKSCTAVKSVSSVSDEERVQSSPCGTSLKLAVKINKHAVKRFLDDTGNMDTETMEETVTHHGQNVTGVKQRTKEEEGCERPGIAAAEIRPHMRENRKKPRKVSSQKRGRKALSASKVIEEEVEDQGEEMPSDQLDVVRACSSDHGVLTSRLLRSHSCPEILSLLHRDSPWTLLFQRRQSLHAPHPLRSSRRARRHTVCSLEVEREIAPLCLRKEVYPTRGCSPYGNRVHHLSPSVPLSPSISFSAQACRFLSSPLAFLSKKTDKRIPETSGNGSPLSPSVFASSSPTRSSPWQPFPGSNLTPLSRSTTSTSVSSLCNALSQIPLEGEIETRQRRDYDDGEDTSCSSQEFESMGMREEKALSDSEIKMGSCKTEERGKVSSIRIRRALPKPQTNLTPMGLPRPVRLKKKEFSLEEIYTNQNFTKPSEGRLETIFELPLNRRNGSQSLIGQKRMKRFLEFPELGGARKPRKSLVGAGKVGIPSTVGRPRRGNVPNSKDEHSLHLQDLDSLLCSKLDELDYWSAFNQEAS